MGAAMRPLAIPVLLAAAACGGRKVDAPLRLLAASSLREAIGDCLAAWPGSPGLRVETQFDASSTLARQIREGAPCDLFLSADPAWAGEVSGLDRFEWVANRAVVVVPREAAYDGLARVGSLALGDAGVPIGKLARKALDRQGISPGRIVYGSNARDVLAKVREGAAAAAIVYATDARIDPSVRIAEPLEEGTRYVVVLVTPRGKALFEALREPWARTLAAARGFLPD